MNLGCGEKNQSSLKKAKVGKERGGSEDGDMEGGERGGDEGLEGPESTTS